jgi:hypothetical protein
MSFKGQRHLKARKSIHDKVNELTTKYLQIIYIKKQSDVSQIQITIFPIYYQHQTEQSTKYVFFHIFIFYYLLLLD